MNIEKLQRETVRSTRKIEDFVYLSPEELRKVVGGGNAVFDDVDPETCAIHFYYPSDTVD